MEDNNNKNQEKGSDSIGTGVLSSIVFTILAVVIMYLLAKYRGI